MSRQSLKHESIAPPHYSARAFRSGVPGSASTAQADRVKAGQRQPDGHEVSARRQRHPAAAAAASSSSTGSGGLDEVVDEQARVAEEITNVEDAEGHRIEAGGQVDGEGLVPG